MKQIVSITLAALLVLSLSACGGKDAPEPISGGGPVGGQAEEPGMGTSHDAPQAGEALVKEIVLTYGAGEDTLNGPPAIVVKKKSLFLREEGWSGGEGLAPADYLYWVDSLPLTEEEWNTVEEGQHYAQDHKGESPFGYRFFPPELVEGKVLSRFDVTPEHLRSDPENYDSGIPAYFLPAGGGMGAPITVSYTWSQEGDTLTIPVALDRSGGGQPDCTHTLTVRLEEDGGWKYLGCQVA